MKTVPSKDPSELVKYRFDFTTLLDVAETIASAVSTVNFIRGPVIPAGSQLTAMLSGSPTIVGQAVTQEVTGGFHGDYYTVEVEITSSIGQVVAKSICIPVQEI